jgi:hypothetical protein
MDSTASSASTLVKKRHSSTSNSHMIMNRNKMWMGRRLVAWDSRLQTFGFTLTARHGYDRQRGRRKYSLCAACGNGL